MATKLILITGLSGSGKSTVANCFEDLGYYCVDNMPLPLLERFVRAPEELVEGHRRLAVVADVRAPGFAQRFPQVVAGIDRSRISATLLFLEASEQTLVRRFSETRRPHPLAGDRPLLEAIVLERELTADLRGSADMVLDTSEWSIHEVRNEIFREFAAPGEEPAPVVSLVSFGFKHGIPAGADLVFDLRFLSNPHFVAGLREQTGQDAAVREYLDSLPEYGEFLAKVEELLLFVLPRYRREPRSYVSVAVGCTGGRHRSVAAVEELRRRLATAGWPVRLIHRDLERSSR